jgi:DNA polymerase
VVLVNALKCRGPAQRKPLPGEIEACQHYLARQIALLRPRMILAMGRLAAQADRHRGTTFHPTPGPPLRG